MAADDQTLAFYDREAGTYAARDKDHVAAAPLRRFIEGVSPRGDVLDFGCGSGWAAARFRDAGFSVSAFDGSQGLADEARERYGLDVQVAPFEAFDAKDAFDGIWASFCLLHDSREAMPSHLTRLGRALRPGGLLYLGLKEGTGSRRDALGRRYTYFGRDEISDLLTHAGFDRPDVRPYASMGLEGAEEACLDIFARRG